MSQVSESGVQAKLEKPSDILRKMTITVPSKDVDRMFQ